jgi:type 1 fimbria pilin
MRSILVVALVLATPAFADDSVEGTYDVKFEAMASTCSPNPEHFEAGKAVIKVKKTTLSVKVDGIYEMVGTPHKDGTIDVKTVKPIGTSMGGLSANYSATGHAEGGTLELGLTAKYIRQDTQKQHCALAWKITGARIAGDKAPKK